MKRIPWFSVCLLAIPLLAANPPAVPHPTPKPLKPAEFDGAIGQVTAQLLGKYHYLQHEVNDEISSRFLDHYLESLDPQRVLFLEADARQFEAYRTTLDDLTARLGDVSPAHLIFNRFLERLEARHTYVMELLKNEKFTFDTDERYLLNRKDAPRPKSLEEARQLWLQRLRNEYLTEKLAVEKPGQKGAAKPGTAKTADQPAKSWHDMIIEKLTRRYDREHDYLVKLDHVDVLSWYLKALSRAFDPHSEYMSGPELENFNIGMRLSLFGIGARLRDEDGYCTVDGLMPGPAMKSNKIKPKDKIVAVAQAGEEPVDVVGMKLGKVVELIRGPKDTEVQLTILPAEAADPSERRVVKLVRDEIKLEDQEAKARLIELPAGNEKAMRIGVIDLPSFYADFGNGDNPKPKEERKSTALDVAVLINKLKQENVSGIVLDLRRNGGGSLEEAVKTTGVFIKDGPVVSVKDSLDRRFVDADTDPGVLWDGPLVVLTSRFSASASEILAGALQDYGRAVVVGESSTHGKGTVQTLLDIDTYLRPLVPGLPADFKGGGVKLTIRKFYLPSGASTQKAGVTPDVILPSVNNHREDIGEAHTDNPLPWDTLDNPPPFTRLNRVRPHLAELRKRSQERIAKDPDFGYIREDIERYRQLIADKTVSLNEAQRRKEAEEHKARLDARKKEILARKDAEPKSWQFTLKEARLPGLPSAGATTNLASVATSAHPSLDPAKRIEVEDGEVTEEEKLPDTDAPLHEATLILLDYIQLTATGRAVAATK
jgi:carboxyl-terminal processing protease